MVSRPLEPAGAAALAWCRASGAFQGGIVVSVVSGFRGLSGVSDVVSGLLSRGGSVVSGHVVASRVGSVSVVSGFLPVFSGAFFDWSISRESALEDSLLQ